MNALASVNPPPGVLDGLLSPATINLPGALPAETAPAGFVSLINLLLVPAEPASPSEPDQSQTMRSPQLIADALIRSMLSRSTSGSDLPTPSALATARETKAASPLAGKLPAQGAPPTRKERAALILRTPVAHEPFAQEPVAAAAPVIPTVVTPTPVIPMVTAPPPAPAKAVTPVPPPVTARSTKQPDATPIQSETSKNVVPSAPDETVVPVTKTAFSLRLTPIEVPKNDCPETPESQPGAFPHPELPPAAEVADDFMASIANVSAPVVAGAPNAKPPTPKETASKSPPASPEVPALGTLRPAPEPAQNTVSAVTAVAAVPSTGIARIPSPGLSNR